MGFDKKEYRKDNAERIAKQQKQYRKDNVEKEKQYRKYIAENITDAYIRRALSVQSLPRIPAAHITQEMIELKRVEIKMQRALMA